MQKYANLVELEKCCRTHIFLQKFVLMQPRTSPPKNCKKLRIFPILLTLTPYTVTYSAYRGLIADPRPGPPRVAAKLADGRRGPVPDIASEPAFPGSHAEPLSGRVLRSDFEHALIDGPVRGNAQASYFLHDVPHLQADGSTWGICTRRAGKRECMGVNVWE